MTDIILQPGHAVLGGVSLTERLAIAGLRLSSAVLRPTHFKGYGRVASLLRKASPKRHVILQLDHDCQFRFPFGDAYWSRLLARSVVYEPEMLDLFRLIRSEDYALVDCGANFGYWTVLVTGAALGAKPAIAIEASGKNVVELVANAALNGNRYQVVHVAVAEVDGGTVTLGGPTHEGLAIIDPATAAPDAETVTCVSLDGLLKRTPMLKDAHGLVLKLDVEGVEEAALRGATTMLSRDTLLIYEEQGSDKLHGNTRYVAENLGMRVFLHRNGRFIEATDPTTEVAAMKTNSRRGYNVVATKSQHWLRALRGQA